MRHIHADHMIAAANDTSIEWQAVGPLSREWIYTGKSGEFMFYPDSQYRQKPAEPKMVDMWQWARKERGIILASTSYFVDADEAQAAFQGIVICRIEGSKITVPEVSQ